MKYRKKFAVCSLIGLIVLINSCSDKKGSIQLLYTTELNYPSASAIEFYENRLYLFGDDARTMLVLSPEHTLIDSVLIADKGSRRISKEEKHDIESALIVVENGKPYLFGIGSMSANKRGGVLRYDLRSGSIYYTRFFDSTKTFPGIEAINLEGSCAVGPYIVFSNRANLSHPTNHLLYWNKNDSLGVKVMQLPRTEKLAGLSGLYYVKEKDILFFTASEEETESTTSDGAIGDSYLGWISNFSNKAVGAELKPDRMITLSEVNAAFMKQKVESLCVEKEEEDGLILHLVSDNDDGRSKIFKIKLQLQ